MNDSSARDAVADLLPRLRTPEVTYFPIRHHSPACAEFLRNWISANQPAAVLVEGPSSFDRFIEALVDPECECPVAVYSHFIDRRGLTQRQDASTNEEGDKTDREPPRFAAFYPFCDYSPELVALRCGRAIGAKLRFIDLEFSGKVLAEFAGNESAEPTGVRIESLASDPHLQRSRYMVELSRRFGCRDFDELWDHLFESGAASDFDTFVDRMAAYCAIARLDYDDEALARDGTTAREACMAGIIKKEITAARKKGRPVLVVTGGFHTAALPALVNKKSKKLAADRMPDDEVGDWLVPYSFEQLDSLSGYASGMPNPAFYDRMWQVEDEAARRREAAAVLLEVARSSRSRSDLAPVSTPDVIAAQRCAEELAQLRGHRWPQREDVLDGARSCFVKGDMATDGFGVMQLLRDVLAGDRVGRTPPQVELPAIVDDFRIEAGRLRIALDQIEPRSLTLDLYRKPRYRQVSRFLHRLDFLGAPLAAFEAGPDFVQGTGLDRMQEQWRVRWTPGVEAALIEASIYGATVESAAAGKLDEAIAKLAKEGKGRSASVAVDLLIRACRLGLHAHMRRLIAEFDSCLQEDYSFSSVVAALSQLDLLHMAREPLGAAGLDSLPSLAASCFQRATGLLPDLAACPDEEVNVTIDAMRALRESVVANDRREDSLFDAELMRDGLLRMANQRTETAQPAVVGAAAGLLHLEGQLDSVGLVDLVTGFLGSSVAEPRRRCGVVRGLLATAREAAWQVSALLDAIDSQLGRWDESDFLSALPELRLAFADLSPNETTKVAQKVAELHEGSDLGELVLADIEEGDALFAARITQIVRDQLAAESFRNIAE